MERISLSNTAFEGSNDVYLFADGPETTLVDTGDGTPVTRRQLREELDGHGVAFADVDRILLTHWHHDHVGLAGAIQSESGASVHVHEADADLVAGDERAWSEMEARREELFDVWGMPPAERAALRERVGGLPSADGSPDVTAFRDGETFSANGRELTAVHVSGHAAGLCVFEVDRDGGREVLSGDALLPEYTPNVGGADVRVERPLARYLDGLETIAAADYDRAWPGHRYPIDDPSARAADIVHHHEERAWRVLDALRREGPCDTWTVSDELFGSLDGIHILHGPGEAYAHLDHLHRAGTVVREGNQYRLADGVEERLDSAATERWPLDR